MMNPRFRRQHKNKMAFGFLCAIGLAFLLVWLVQWLWNTLLPEILGVKTISYWQAFGLLVLSKILFGGFRFHKPRNGFNKRRKLEQLKYDFSDKERNKFREEWKKRFGDRCQF